MRLACAIVVFAAALAAATPSIELTGLDGKRAAFQTGDSTATVVIFISTLCPISIDYLDRFEALARDFETRGVKFLFVDANVNEPDSSVAQYIKSNHLPYSIYRDPSSALTLALSATVTPEAFVLDRTGAIRYQGAIDDARNPARVKQHTLRNAIAAVIEGKQPNPAERKAFGCVIKRKKSS